MSSCDPLPPITDPNLLQLAALTGSGFARRVAGAWTLSGVAAADVTGLGTAALQPSSAFAPAVHVHALATNLVAGFMSTTDKVKLDGIATGANLYVHPSGDGNLHVPATGTSNANKFLMAGPTPGSLTWSAVPVVSVAGKTGPVTLVPADIGLGNVNNTSDANKPISTAAATAFANRLRIDASQTLTSPQQAFGRSNLGLGTAALSAAGDFATASHTHPIATPSAAGFLSAADKSKLDSLSTGGYTPPTGDGFLYVPATGTTHNGMVLTAGATAGAISWQLPVMQSVAGRTGAVVLTKADVGLGNVDNTSDVNKPVSTATATALAGKAALSHTHANASTTVPGFMSDTDKTKLDGIAVGAQVNVVLSVAGKVGAVTLVPGEVGLGNVDNTADVNKPVSTAQAAAIASAVSAATDDVVRYTLQSLTGTQQTQARNNIFAQVARTELTSYATIGGSLTSAATVDLSAAADWRGMGKGTVSSITTFTIPANAVRTIRFEGTGSDTVTLVYDSDKMRLPGLADLVLYPGDIVRIRGHAANKATVEMLQRADGSALFTPHLAIGGVTGSNVPTAWIGIGFGVKPSPYPIHSTAQLEHSLQSIPTARCQTSDAEQSGDFHLQIIALAHCGSGSKFLETNHLDLADVLL